MPALLFVAFVVMPLVELYVIVQVGQNIGVLPTIGLLLLVSVLGAWLVRREGARTWRSFRLALAENRVPARETADGALVIFGGALLLTPGFVSDVLGLLCILPPTRAALRKMVLSVAVRQFGLGRRVMSARDNLERVQRVQRVARKAGRMRAAGRRPANVRPADAPATSPDRTGPAAPTDPGGPAGPAGPAGT
jgi:UPF0716 protein FxsA